MSECLCDSQFRNNAVGQNCKSALIYSSLYRFTRGKSPDNVNFCQPVIIRNQIYSQYNSTFDLHHQKTSIRTKVMEDQNDSPKLTSNPSINSALVFYSLIPTTYFLLHQKTSIRTKVIDDQKLKLSEVIEVKLNGSQYKL